MKYCGIISLTLLIIISFVGCGRTSENNQLEIKRDRGYPRWLMSGDYVPDQTSGIAFIDESPGFKNFLLCDDVGAIHRLQIRDDTSFTLFKVSWNNEFEQYLADFPKRDFEEIAYDKQTGTVYLSIEGNRPDPKKFAKIIKLNFLNNNPLSDSIISFEELIFSPEETFSRYLDNNISYEGLAVNQNYIYLGLEGFSKGGVFADSTVILIAEKKSGKIIKEIGTKKLGIHTICGLYAADDGLWGIDRNNKKIFRLILNGELNVTEAELFEFETVIPGYNEFVYVGAMESITLDNERNIYLIDDPWKQYYVPSDEILSKLDEETAENFKRFIPIIYKFKLNF